VLFRPAGAGRRPRVFRVRLPWVTGTWTPPRERSIRRNRPTPGT